MQWQLAPYTEADLQRQIDLAEQVYGARGKQVSDDLNEYVAGINQYISEAQLDPSKKPAEYSLLNIPLQPWKGTDVVATASLIGGIFGKGGGSELLSAQTLQAFVKRFGTSRGRAAWSDFREKNDPETPVTANKPLPVRDRAARSSKRGLAMPDPGTREGRAARRRRSRAASAAKSALGFDPHSLIEHSHMSNSLLVPARNSTTGHPVAVMGPQVGYYVPQILMEEDLHGPGIDARGVAFPGVNQYVELGHGRDYAWSATTAGSDNIDTFAEKLCQDDFHYMWHGKCVAMEKLDRTNSWTPNPQDTTPPGSETLTVYRTVHGIVTARAKVHGQPVAYASARTTYFHEADSALGFSELNDPGFVKNAKSFQRAASDINFAFNWLYTDSKDIAYYQSGWYPQRAPRTSPDFPIFGTGAFDWRKLNTDLHTEALLPYARHPNAINQKFIVSWNNKQAPRWSAADDNYHWGAAFRAQLLIDPIAPGSAGGQEGLRAAARADHGRGRDAGPARREAPAGAVAGGRQAARPQARRRREAAARLACARVAPPRPRQGRPLRRQRGRHADGRLVATAAARGVPARCWAGAVLADAEDARAGRAQGDGRSLVAFVRDRLVRPGVEGPAHAVRQPKPRGRYSRVYCGRGSAPLPQRAARLAGGGAEGDAARSSTARTRTAPRGRSRSCSDETLSVSTSAISIPAFPLQNRPTFQQTVELTKRLAR